MKNKYSRTIYTKQDAGAFFMLSLFAPQIFGVILVFLVVLISIISKIDYETLTSNPVTVIFLTLSTQLSFILIFFLYNKILKFDVKKANKIYFKNSFLNIFLAITIGIVTLFGFQFLISLVDELIAFLNLPTSDLPLPINTWYWLVINIALLAFVPAVCEELIFRGVIFNGLMQYTTPKKSGGKPRVWIAVIGSALLFALLHGSVEQTVYPIIFGIVLAILAYKTKSIVPGMIAHFVNNTIVLIINYLYATNVLTQSTVTQNDYMYYISGIVITIIAIIIIWLLTKPLKANKQATMQTLSPEIVEENLSEEIVINHDIKALEQTQKQPNLFLWLGVGFGMLFWIISLFG